MCRKALVLVFPFCLLSEEVGHLVRRCDVQNVKAVPGPGLPSWADQFGTMYLWFLSSGGGGVCKLWDFRAEKKE